MTRAKVSAAYLNCIWRAFLGSVYWNYVTYALHLIAPAP